MSFRGEGRGLEGRLADLDREVRRLRNALIPPAGWTLIEQEDASLAFQSPTTGVTAPVGGIAPGFLTATAPITYDPSTLTIGVKVGTTPGTVAAGDDPRFGSGGPPSGAAGGSLAGTYPNPTIAALAVGTAQLAAGAVTLAKQANIATASIMGRITAGTGVQEVLTPAQAKTVLAIASGDISGLGPYATAAAGSLVDADIHSGAAIDPAKIAGTAAVHTDNLSVFAATTSAQLAALLSDETGSGAAVFANGPTLIAPLLGTPASGVATNLTGTAAGLTAGHVTTNANLTGPVTSVGNATSIATGAITSAMILDGTIVDADINAAAGIAFSKLATPVANVSLGSNRLTNVSDPIGAQDAATKNYVDALAGGVDWKSSVRVATTTDGTLATAFVTGQTVDGVVLATGDRILLKNQTSGAGASDNGIRVVAASGAPARASDAATSVEVTTGMACFVEEGTVNANTGWLITTPAPITLGTTALTFTQFTGLGEVIAGNGLSKSGNTLTIDTSITADLHTAQALTNKDLSGVGMTWPTFNQNTTGSAAKWTVARLLAGNSIDGSTNVAFANKFIAQGTSDAGLSAAQFLGNLGTGILKNTATTGVLSIAVAGDFPTLNQDTTGKSAKTDALNSATTVIDVAAATAPTLNQVLAATDSTHATWQTVSSLGVDTVLIPTGVKTANYPAVASDLVPCDTTSAGFTVTLPAAPADRTRIAVKHVIQGGTNTVTVACAGSDVFNKAGGATTLTLSLLAQAVMLQYKASGAIWYVLADDLALAQLDARYLASSVSTAAVVQGTRFAGATIPDRSLDRLRAEVVPRTATLNTTLPDGTGTTLVVNLGLGTSLGFLHQDGLAVVVRIDNEQMLIAATTGLLPTGTAPNQVFTYTVTRGVNGTTAAAHTAGATITTSAVTHICWCGDSIVSMLADDLRRDLDRRLGGSLGLGFRGMWRGNEITLGATGGEWLFLGTLPTVATTPNDVGPWKTYSFVSGSGNTATWTKPANAHVAQLDVFWVDVNGGTGNWSYSTDGGTTWVNNPNYPGARPTNPTLMKSTVVVNDPATLMVRAADASGTGAAQIFSGVDVWSTKEEFGVTTGFKLHEISFGGQFLLTFAALDSGVWNRGRIFDGDAASLSPILTVVGTFSNDATLGFSNATYVANLATVVARLGPYSDLLFLACYDHGLPLQDVRLATAAALPACTYNNGTAGVGATLTANANGALSVDGIAVAANDRVLVKDQASTFQNGIYTVTAAGSAGAVFVLTRATDFDQTTEINRGGVVHNSAGTANVAHSGWYIDGFSGADNPTTIGTDSITFGATPTYPSWYPNQATCRADMAAAAAGKYAILDLTAAFTAEGYGSYDAMSTLNSTVVGGGNWPYAIPAGFLIDGAHPTFLGQRDIVGRLSRLLQF